MSSLASIVEINRRFARSARLDADLNKFALHTHGAAIAQLQVLMQYRQQVMQMEAAEMQRQHQLRAQEQETKQRAAAFEKAQAAQKPELIAQ